MSIDNPEENLRLTDNVKDISEVHEATLELNGTVSGVKKYAPLLLNRGHRT